jgi:threonine dehydrogenase-like Zn-dependent dehydrogenase
MRSALLTGARSIEVRQVPDPVLAEPTDALVQVVAACVCGSDLWEYRSDDAAADGPHPMGHEFVGVVTDVGDEVHRIRAGQFVVAPFLWNDGDCRWCAAGLPSSCVRGGIWGWPDVDGHPVPGGQGEFVRVPFADATLLPAPEMPDPAMVPALAALSDVVGTGHYAAVSGGVRAGSVVAVVGDGAVGLCAVLAAVRLGAERVIALSSHADRADIARRFGATDVVTGRGPYALAQVQELVGDALVPHVLECVGTDSSWSTAFDIVAPGGHIGYVGVPAGVTAGLPLRRAYGKNLHLAGGVAPVRRYLPELLAAVLDGSLDPSPVLTDELPLDRIGEGYAAMDERRAVKVLIRP